MSTSTRTSKPVGTRLAGFAACSLALLVLLDASCRKQLQGDLQGYTDVLLVANNPYYHAVTVDTDLVNPWGMSFSPTSPIWVSDEGHGVSTLYSNAGKKIALTVVIPRRMPTDTTGHGTPTGTVFNSTSSDFWFKSGDTMVQAKFIFSTWWGQIVAWAGGDTATVVASRDTSFAEYTGLALATTASGANYLYAPDFQFGKIDVYDKDFNPVSGMKFWDPNLPQGYAPFNIRAINGLLYVTYAMHQSGRNDLWQSGPGLGIIDIFRPDGNFVIRFAGNGPLNAPWAVLPARAAFMTGNIGMNKNGDSVGVILVGNHGDGLINMFNATGQFIGPLMNGSMPIVVDSLWDLENTVGGANANQLYYTAGRHNGTNGNLGIIEKQ
jgi:uncharacterized protein (TIGR03118 family)